MKKEKYFCLGLLLCLTGSAVAQNAIPKRAYWHLAGTISTTVNVKMNLVRVNDSIYADCILSANGSKALPGSPERNKPLDFCGKIDAHGNFTIHPFSQDFPVFSGQIGGDGKVKGEFEEGKGREKYSFALNEMYEAGSVQFNVYSLFKSVPLVEKAKSPTGKISMVFLSPLESADAIISDSLRRLMIADFNNSSYSGSDPDSVLYGNFLHFQRDYITSNEDLYQQSPDIPLLNWELMKYLHLICNEKYWLSYYVLNYAFTGGAHGLETREYQTIDLKSGKIISLDSILTEGKKPELSKLLTAKLRLSNNIPATQKLSEAGYFVDEIQPNENFYIIPEGIGFFYNHYDIAPYSSGSTEIFLKMEEIREFLKPGALRF